MKALLWLGIIGAFTVSVLIACVPGPATVSAHHQALMRDLGTEISQRDPPTRACDERGICCYAWRSSTSISCVATRIIVITEASKEQSYEREDQGGAEIVGEVQSPALEARLLRDYRYGTDQLPNTGDAARRN